MNATTISNSSIWTSYVPALVLTTAAAIAAAWGMWFLPDERPLLIVLGPPTIIYFQLAELAGLGWPLLIGTFLGYFALLLLPVALFKHRSKRTMRFLLTSAIVIHFTLGLAVAFSVHPLHLEMNLERMTLPKKQSLTFDTMQYKVAGIME